MAAGILGALDDRALTSRLRQVDLCARLKPQHKLRLVNLLPGQPDLRFKLDGPLPPV